MKKNSTLRLLFTFTLVFSLLFILFSSCHRNKDCDLVLSVVDGTTNGPVVGAEVHISPNQSGANGNLQIQDQKGTTDAAGVATFTFKLPAILSADVVPPAPYTAPAQPTLVKLEEGRSVSTTIKVY
jgi:hypothetical protein